MNFPGSNYLTLSGAKVRELIQDILNRLEPDAIDLSYGKATVRFKLDLTESDTFRQACQAILPDGCYILKIENPAYSEEIRIEFTSDLSTPSGGSNDSGSNNSASVSGT